MSDTTETPAVKTQPAQKDYSNLRHRPFLVITTVQRPVKPSITRKAGWAEAEGNWTLSERTTVEDRIKPRMLREATVIIDVMKSRCIKNRFAHVTDAEVVHHYLDKYRDMVKQGMGRWIDKMAARMAADPSFARPSQDLATADATDAAAIEAFSVVCDEPQTREDGEA